MAPTVSILLRRGELLPYKGDFYLWKYVPSMAAAVIFLILFLIASAMHTWKMYRQRMWFCVCFVIGGYLEVIGYGGRIGANNATDQLGPYIIQSVFLLVPPSLFAASIYMTLGRVMRGLGPEAERLSIVRVNWLTKTFVIGDAFAFLVQASGAGYMAAGTSAKTGEIIVIFGLVVQIVFFGLFVVAAIVFHKRYNARLGTFSPFDWGKIMKMLYITSALILIRCIFRIIEYGGGSNGYLLRNEWPLYIFDSILMLAVMVVFYIWYPNELQKK
ncbi:RTA1-domain-containing protein [Aaosphaeria arxii CBS 175.79]|uniref:RTA1-domain-containing protein n=1 Tax=Aaosphaeria arxii CBS 175.79 TaxID=1450172 RepID=A0A6A5XFP9_9PLEO|nr:RTA1-domain-containing protein [Aaosphaeria arxii CBS 175.79]KAF2012065.1 RTA1-domain-containing protein [Aaosphaeria arxii CBS 175.79]